MNNKSAIIKLWLIMNRKKCIGILNYNKNFLAWYKRTKMKNKNGEKQKVKGNNKREKIKFTEREYVIRLHNTKCGRVI